MLPDPFTLLSALGSGVRLLTGAGRPSPSAEAGEPPTGAASFAELLDRARDGDLESGLPVSIADDPLSSVVLGAGKMLSDFALLKRAKWENTLQG